MDNEQMELFMIEYVPVSAEAQAELLEAGLALLEKLPGDIRSCLNCPDAANLTALFLQGNAPLNNLTPERVRAAVAVAEVSLSIWHMMFVLDRRVNPPYPVTLCEQINMLSVGEELCRVSWVIRRIMHSTRLPLGVATAMWEKVVEILREDKVRIPGIRAVKPPVESLGEE